MTARTGDRVMASLARLLLRVFFRRIDVEGATRLLAGPVLLVANHVNGLVDGLVLMAVLPRDRQPGGSDRPPPRAAPASATVTVVVSRPDRSRVPGRASSSSPPCTTGSPLTSTWLMPTASP